MKSIQAHRFELRRFDFSRDERYYATSSSDGTAQVRDAATHEPVGAPLVHASAVTHLQFSADSTRVATSTAAGANRVWDVLTGLPLHDPFQPDLGAGHYVSFSPDGRLLLTTYGMSMSGPSRVWSTPPTSPGGRAPAWLLRLATVCSGRRLNESAKLVSALDEFDCFGGRPAAVRISPSHNSVGRFVSGDSAANSS